MCLLLAGAVLLLAPSLAAEGSEADPTIESGTSSWRGGPARPFVSSAVDVGFRYFRPRVSAGYGLPHDTWGGVDANPIVSPAAIGAYGGVRLAVPIVDLRAGARFFHGLRRSFLPIRHAYDREAIEFRGEGDVEYVAWEAEASIDVPAGPVLFLSETSVSWAPGIPDDRYVFLESVRVVADDGWVGRQRVGVGIRLAERGALLAAAVAEVVRVPGRDLDVWRGGVLLRFRLFDDLELRGNFVPVLVSRDSLGMVGGDFAHLGIRWLWATEAPGPRQAARAKL